MALTQISNYQGTFKQGPQVLFQQSQSAATSTNLWLWKAWMSESKMSKAGQCWQRANVLSQLY